MSFVAETDRLNLHLFMPEDAPLVLELVNDPLWLRFIGDRKVRTLDDARAYIRKLTDSYEKNGYGLYLVERKEDGELLGMCGLVKRDTLPDADLGFAFLERFRGAGYALEAAKGTMALARESLGLGRILAIVSPDNERSARLLEKLGFIRERSIVMNGNDQDPVDLWAHRAN
jgi:RimJ/RimL family protein N-acetyltransferase